MPATEDYWHGEVKGSGVLSKYGPYKILLAILLLKMTQISFTLQPNFTYIEVDIKHAFFIVINFLNGSETTVSFCDGKFLLCVKVRRKLICKTKRRKKKEAVKIRKRQEYNKKKLLNTKILFITFKFNRLIL